GAMIGVTAAILFAPKSGKETRRYLADKAQAGRDAVENASTDIVDASRDMFERGRKLVEDAADLFERGRERVRGCASAFWPPQRPSAISKSLWFAPGPIGGTAERISAWYRRRCGAASCRSTTSIAFRSLLTAM